MSSEEVILGQNLAIIKHKHVGLAVRRARKAERRFGSGDDRLRRAQPSCQLDRHLLTHAIVRFLSLDELLFPHRN